MRNTIAIMLICGATVGCASQRTVQYNEPSLDMSQSGLCTLVGTDQQRLARDFGRPDNIVTTAEGETWHYALEGQLTTETVVPFLDARMQVDDITEDLYVDLQNGCVSGGRWRYSHRQGQAEW